jgi:hypothetical protein
MKYLKKFKSVFHKYRIDPICAKFNINNYTINDNGSIDVDGNVYLKPVFSYTAKEIANSFLKEIPVKFSKISGNFFCSNNKLTSLKGSPKLVNGDFGCHNNKLTSLQGCPEKIDGNFTCNNNYLTSLKYGPKLVGNNFICSSNNLTSLEGSPTKVSGDFNCSMNKLTSLVGCPEIIGRHFFCQNNMITDFSGISEFFEGDFYCNGNPIYEIYSLFNSVRCIQLINEFDVIDGKKVILDRLEEVFHQLGMGIPQNIKFENYEII